MRIQDWESVRAIYVQGIATGDATFEQTRRIGKRGMPRIFPAADSSRAAAAKLWGGPR
jgi:L-amino acid N-acyltransferase YncA